jgi:molybdopterin-containing oxidoreductase family membrane subunit
LVFLESYSILLILSRSSAEMDGAATAPDVIQDEATASVERPLARVPLVLNRRSFRWITDRISGVIESAAPRWWWVAF